MNKFCSNYRQLPDICFHMRCRNGSCGNTCPPTVCSNRSPFKGKRKDSELQFLFQHAQHARTVECPCCKSEKRLWYNKNSHKIEALSVLVGATKEEVLDYLYMLTLKKFSEAFNPHPKNPSICMPPYTSVYDCEYYNDIFDLHGNLRDPDNPASLVLLVKIMRYFFHGSPKDKTSLRQLLMDKKKQKGNKSNKNRRAAEIAAAREKGIKRLMQANLNKRNKSNDNDLFNAAKSLDQYDSSKTGGGAIGANEPPYGYTGNIFDNGGAAFGPGGIFGTGGLYHGAHGPFNNSDQNGRNRKEYGFSDGRRLNGNADGRNAHMHYGGLYGNFNGTDPYGRNGGIYGDAIRSDAYGRNGADNNGAYGRKGSTDNSDPYRRNTNQRGSTSSRGPYIYDDIGDLSNKQQFKQKRYNNDYDVNYISDYYNREADKPNYYTIKKRDTKTKSNSIHKKIMNTQNEKSFITKNKKNKITENPLRREYHAVSVHEPFDRTKPWTYNNKAFLEQERLKSIANSEFELQLPQTRSQFFSRSNILRPPSNETIMKKE